MSGCNPITPSQDGVPLGIGSDPPRRLPQALAAEVKELAEAESFVVA